MGLAGSMLQNAPNADYFELRVSPGWASNLKPVPKFRLLQSNGQDEHFSIGSLASAGRIAALRYSAGVISYHYQTSSLLMPTQQ